MCDGRGFTPLSWITYPITLVELLLDAGADVNYVSPHGTPLDRFIMLGWTDAIHLLLERGADPNMRDDEGYTPLMLAVIQRHPTIIQILLDEGVDPRHRNIHDYTAYDYADDLIARNIIGAYPQSLYRRKDRSLTYMSPTYSDIDILT